MARPIRETPILFGEDARRFIARMQERHPETPEARALFSADAFVPQMRSAEW